MTATGYDSFSRLVTNKNDLTSPSIVEAYTYDDRGLMTEAIKGDGTTVDAFSRNEMDYNGLGRITRVWQEVLNSGNTYTGQKNVSGTVRLPCLLILWRIFI